MSELTEQQLLEETQRRRRIRNDLIAWSQHLGFEPALHHRYLINVLEKVSRGDLRKVMIMMPPGAAKSTYTSKSFPPWYLGQHPTHPILACSHSASLAATFGRAARNNVEAHSNILGYELAKDSQAADEWETSKGGRYFCAGVGGKIAGHRAGLGFIDDYLGSQEDADSKVIRDKQWDWYTGDFYPRLWPGAPQVIVANRRHEDDLIGRLLAEEKDEWAQIRFPMLAEDDDVLGRQRGEILWPEWFTMEMAEKARSKNARIWACLYQQRPAPEEGDYFQRKDIVEYTLDDLAAAQARGMRFYGASDHAVRTGQENDYTLLLIVGVDTIGRVWVMPDWFWEKADTLTVCEKMMALAKKYRPIMWWAGADHITGSIGPFLRKMMLEQSFFFPLDEQTSNRDKMAKCRSIAGRMQQQLVLFPKFANRWDEAKHELLTFPGALHDEWPDALGCVGRGLESMFAPTAISVPQPTELPTQFVPTMDWVRSSHNRLAKQRKRELAMN